MTQSSESVPKRWTWLILFASSTTLLCCALPIVLVALGLGAVSASLFANLPFLVTLAHYKAWMFTISGGALLITGWVLFRPGRTCPVDPEIARLCEQAHLWNVRLFWLSSVVWMVGFVAAYLSLPLLLWFDA